MGLVRVIHDIKTYGVIPRDITETNKWAISTWKQNPKDYVYPASPTPSSPSIKQTPSVYKMGNNQSVGEEDDHHSTKLPSTKTKTIKKKQNSVSKKKNVFQDWNHINSRC